ncbi:MAG: DUF6941 family protein [Acidimicrobiales bacterium]
MAEIDLALLCSAATFRDGLLSILEGGLERFSPDGYPANIAPNLVFRLTYSEEDFGVAHVVRASVRHTDGEVIADVGVGVKYGQPRGAAPELSYYTVVIHQLLMQIRRDGVYDLQLALNGDPVRRIPFQVQARLPHS